MGNAVPRHRLFVRTGLALAPFCALAAGLSLVPVKAEPPATFVIPANDGYGLGECLTGRKPCGRIVADAWSAAHGRGPARAFGRAEVISASSASVSPKQRPMPRAV